MSAIEEEIGFQKFVFERQRLRGYDFTPSLTLYRNERKILTIGARRTATEADKLLAFFEMFATIPAWRATACVFAADTWFAGKYGQEFREDDPDSIEALYIYLASPPLLNKSYHVPYFDDHGTVSWLDRGADAHAYSGQESINDMVMHMFELVNVFPFHSDHLLAYLVGRGHYVNDGQFSYI